ncbi:hypothetical protein [Alkalibacterium sp. MB6]|uniref:hypothetical protein n=1 Tax=Alkalibacterium sp. MB6 TaxID=2081965 RepID=UPI00137AFA31|nr:hypothetical protein [Alkalibacterium sp. MB6]
MSLFEKVLMNLQFFAADDGSNGGTGDPASETGSEPTGTGEPENNPEDKVFKQEDVNNIVAKESKKATEKLLKELGVEDFDNAKDGLVKFKEWQDSQKTEQEKKDEELGKLQKTNQEKEQALSNLQAQLSAMKQGVNPDSLEDVIALAERLVGDDTDIDAAIKQVIEKYPHFSSQDAKEDEASPYIVKKGNPNGRNNKNETDPFAAKIAKYQ